MFTRQEQAYKSRRKRTLRPGFQLSIISTTPSRKESKLQVTGNLGSLRKYIQETTPKPFYQYLVQA